MSSKKIAVVTGASKGIGYGIAEQLATDGFKVVVTSRSQVNADAAAAGLQEKTAGEIIGLAYDMTNPKAAEALIAATVSTFGDIDILVNNALANCINAPLLQSDDADIDFAVLANLTSVIKLCKYAHPYLAKNSGAIVNIGSSITKRYVNGMPLYAMYKAALVKLTEALAADWAVDGIRLNTVNPGFTFSSAAADLGLSAEQVAGLYQYLNQFQPLGTAQPADVAQMVAYLGSEKAAKISGAVIDVDGGHHIQGHPLFPAA
ncbi:SDR family NAD(P)-dependent oxidoreductase [Teredinibacter waterburyi]|uniref:SDR family NAD(P)-dependent oxidoreductase n=1 Tax=Teredinibacter waterburyi TaxID=1500538 RepID=UPI00165EFA9C|nr:SDR family oxidoreductase [Teredinibacter waterburyi]